MNEQDLLSALTTCTVPVSGCTFTLEKKTHVICKMNTMIYSLKYNDIIEIHLIY